MPSVTLVRGDDDHPYGGVSPDPGWPLAWLHDPTVRQWIAEQEATGGRVLIANPAWVNPGDGTVSLTFPVDDRDVTRLTEVYARLAAERTGAAS